MTTFGWIFCQKAVGFWFFLPESRQFLDFFTKKPSVFGFFSPEIRRFLHLFKQIRATYGFDAFQYYYLIPVSTCIWQSKVLLRLRT